ncbi:hypothetical protein HID58_057782, partial [Brassica napus]
MKNKLQVLTVGIGGVAYMRMFGNTVDAMADGARGVMKGAAGQRRLLVLVVLVMIFIRWNTILVPQYEFIALGADTNVDQTRSNVGLSVIFVKSSFVNIIELLTSHLNLFNIFLGASIIGNNNGRRFVFSRLLVPEYWIHALEVETNVGWEKPSPFLLKNRCLKAPVSVYINKLDCCVLRGQNQTRSNVGLSVIFVKSSFVNIIELLTSLLNLFNIFLGASIIGNNNGRFVFSRAKRRRVMDYLYREES